MRKETCSIFTPAPSLHTTAALCMCVCMCVSSLIEGGRAERESQRTGKMVRGRRLKKHNVGDGEKQGQRDSEQLKGQWMTMT